MAEGISIQVMKDIDEEWMTGRKYLKEKLIKIEQNLFEITAICTHDQLISVKAFTPKGIIVKYESRSSEISYNITGSSLLEYTCKI